MPMQLSDLDVNVTYSYADYYSWTFDARVELIKGKIFYLPTPWTLYQIIFGRLSVEIGYYLKGKPCEVFRSV